MQIIGYLLIDSMTCLSISARDNLILNGETRALGVVWQTRQIVIHCLFFVQLIFDVRAVQYTLLLKRHIDKLVSLNSGIILCFFSAIKAHRAINNR